MRHLELQTLVVVAVELLDHLMLDQVGLEL
jgi:hypothetical protein